MAREKQRRPKEKRPKLQKGKPPLIVGGVFKIKKKKKKRDR